ncbi:hypothetical protein R6Q59_008420 [Mikania micrantha]
MPKRGGKAAHDQAFRPSSKVIIKFLMVLQKHGDLHGVQKVLNLNLWVSFLLQAKKMYSDKQGLSIVGYACTTCIGNSRDLDESIAAPISANVWSQEIHRSEKRYGDKVAANLYGDNVEADYDDNCRNHGRCFGFNRGTLKLGQSRDDKLRRVTLQVDEEDIIFAL